MSTFILSLLGYWDWLPLELKEYVLALAEALHKIDLERKRQWNNVLDEMATYHRYKEAWGWGFIELQTFVNCTDPYCRVMRHSKQSHHHVRMYGKYKVEHIDPHEFDYHLGITDQPPQTIHEFKTFLGLLEEPPRTILKSIQHAKIIVKHHFKAIA